MVGGLILEGTAGRTLFLPGVFPNGRHSHWELLLQVLLQGVKMDLNSYFSANV